MSEPRLLGAVLAGGASRRFGSDKAVAPLAGRSLVEHAAEALAPVCEEVVVVSSVPGHDFGSYTTLADSRPGEGPLAALESALGHAATYGFSAVFVLACDMPVSRHLTAQLAGAYDGTTSVAAHREAPPGFEPLCAIYPVHRLGVVTRLLDEGERAARALLETDGGEAVKLGRVPNINTGADLVDFEASTRGGHGSDDRSGDAPDR